MKGLENIPSDDDLTRAMELLQYTVGPPHPIHLVEIAQLCRFDARLAEVWILAISKHWREINPSHFNSFCLKSVWPQAVALLLDLSEALVHDGDLALFSAWKKCVQTNVKSSEVGALFFIGTRKFAGHLMRKDAELSTKTYLRWGYLGREKLTNKNSGRVKTSVGKKQRTLALNALLSKQDRIDVNAYIACFDGQITPRIAQFDLAQNPKLRAVGSTRNRYYVLRREKRRKKENQ